MIDRYPFSRKLAFLAGFSPRVLLTSLIGVPYFLKTFWTYQKLNRRPTFRISMRDLFPILTDRRDSAGTAGGHYFHQDLWAAKKIYEKKPKRHIDIGSRVDGFISHVLVFMPVTIIDIRPLDSHVSNLTFLRDDATKLNQLESNSVESISTLHAAEHFGLGRYSDPIDPSACFEFMQALQRVVAPGGTLYFSVPIGRERVEFNAHRVFSPRTIINSFPQLRLVSYSFVGDEGDLHTDAEIDSSGQCHYGCGLFEFTKAE